MVQMSQSATLNYDGEGTASQNSPEKKNQLDF